ncbi:Rod shape-determining protein MreD [Lentibacillus sp. JNUCC-1]|uniref:rod shape-determining protein MreD n=1 Tax=Lentibacillus sp. JNUCC-1 TaxID=2654513 RepID=UPI0012E81F6C|nr:rod shape-determining protein MreD [Lentibacillus sp. JNUCC-1]MUV39499.1 Rod shape-determining protein MreD [Lentibacillus sp. JNUCC-1]
MKHLYVPLCLFVFLVFEGVAFELLPASIVSGKSIIVPHWILILIVFISLFYVREKSLLSVGYALVFGFLIDIAYTGILGVYMFGYGAAIYVVYSLMKYLQTNIYSAILHGTIAVIISDVLIGIIYEMVGLTNISIPDYLIMRLIPTVLANLVFLIVLYPVMKNLLIKWGTD